MAEVAPLSWSEREHWAPCGLCLCEWPVEWLSEVDFAGGRGRLVCHDCEIELAEEQNAEDAETRGYV